MEAYEKYINDLVARGYGYRQIRDLLLGQKLSMAMLEQLLHYAQAAVEAAAEKARTELLAQSQNRTQHALQQVYGEYIKILKSRGASDADITKDLQARGVDAAAISALLASVQVQVAAPALKPENSHAVQPAENVPNELEAAAEHLEAVADHLTEVADKLEAIEEKQNKEPSPAQLISTPSITQASPATDDATNHLLAATDHLAAVADKLETAGQQNAGIGLASPLPSAGMVSQPAWPIQSQTNAAEAVANAPTAENEKKGMAVLFTTLVVLGILAMTTRNHWMTWLTLLGLNVVGTVGFNFMLRKLTWAHLDDWFTAAVLQTGLAIPFLVKEIISPITFPAFKPFDLLLLAIAITCLISLQFCNVKALENVEASVYSVVFNTRILFATIFGMIFLNETVGWWAMLGGVLIFAAIFIVRQKGAKAIALRGVMFALGAALSMSTMNTCEKELIKLIGYQQYVFPMFVIAAVIMWCIVLTRKPKVPFDLILKPQSLLLMALRACAGISFSYALVFGPVAVSSYISSLSVILIVIFGVLFFGERDYLRAKITAAATALAGLTFILMDHLL